MHFHILTLFPEMVMHGLSESVIGRALERGILSVSAVDIRDFTLDKHRKTDDYPYGGGAGMVMQAQPVYDAWKSVADRIGRGKSGARVRTVYLTPQGRLFSQELAKELAKEQDLILLCGHYEGVDERVLEEIVTDYVSIGDYVLTGGELPAMVLTDAVGRLVPGVLNNQMSAETETFHGYLLEYPQYSRPAEWNGRKVPAVLLSGDRKKIREWRLGQSVERTGTRRPDLYRQYQRLEACLGVLRREKLHHTDMTELIARGQAELICADGADICLYDKNSGAYFHTAESVPKGLAALAALCEHAGERCVQEILLALHQDFMAEEARRQYEAEVLMECRQAVYTGNVKLPVSGLIRSGEGAEEGLPAIRPLGPEHLSCVAEHYDSVDREYLDDQIRREQMWGAFDGEELLGVAGIHKEGSIGMLTVFPEHRGKRLGKALETFVVNGILECGFTPYCQIEEGNEISMRLQKSLGLYFSGEKLYWMKLRLHR